MCVLSSNIITVVTVPGLAESEQEFGVSYLSWPPVKMIPESDTHTARTGPSWAGKQLYPSETYDMYKIAYTPI